MNEEIFQPRNRIKEVRRLIRCMTSPEIDGPEQEVIDLLEDLARDLANRAEGIEDEAYCFVVRCMGVIARHHAGEAYEPYGYPNPFAAAAKPAPPIPQWIWPVINQPTDSRGTVRFKDIDRDYSALKLFGYTVGKTDGWAQSKREKFLADFMEMNLPPIVEATFGDQYGEPMSTTRLRKMANLIATNATNFYRNDPVRYRAAIEDWESDLNFLKTQYYIRRGLAFQPWPSSRPE